MRASTGITITMRQRSASHKPPDGYPLQAIMRDVVILDNKGALASRLPRYPGSTALPHHDAELARSRPVCNKLAWPPARPGERARVLAP
jgi:hypothetical protein